MITLIPIWIILGYFTITYFNLVNNQMNSKYKIYYNKIQKLIIFLIWPLSISLIKILDWTIEGDYEVT